jgi:hypothetical protein
MISILIYYILLIYIGVVLKLEIGSLQTNIVYKKANIGLILEVRIDLGNILLRNTWGRPYLLSFGCHYVNFKVFDIYLVLPSNFDS